jgi:membrane fusion protein (multidrug efflux system)
MKWTPLKVWACGLTALGLAVAGGVITSQTTRAQSAPTGSGVKPGTPPPKGNKPAPNRDAQQLESLKMEVEALRKRVEALEQKQKQKQADREPRKIVATSPVARDVVLTQQYVCQIHAQRHIEVRALANGPITEVAVKEGGAVKKGEVMFRVLPTLYKAKYEAERAEVQFAAVELKNTRLLREKNVVSDLEVQLYEAKLAKAEARAKVAEAELAFTEVKAPFDGLVGRLREQVGSVVKVGDALTTLADNTVLWVYFKVPEARYFEYAAERDPVKAGLPVELVLADGKKFPQAGRLAAIESVFENDTGSVIFRADFPNPDGLLRHGQTGTVLIHRTLKDVIVIPQRATFGVLDKQYVYVVDKDNVAHRREIVVGAETEDIFVVKNGLDANDRIVLDGLRRVRDGEKVEYEFRKPEEVLQNQKHLPD